MAPERGGSIPEIRRKLLSAPVISKGLSAGKMLEPRIEIVAWGALKSASRAKKMIVDRR
jgi:hypothetical protein